MTDRRPGWSRRRLLRAAGLSVGLATLAGCAAPTASDEVDDEPAAHEVAVGPDGEFVYTPGTDEPLEIDPGERVVWVWASDGHNVNPTDVPADADWEGHQELEDEGFEYEHTFDLEGRYHYVCDPHVEQGMVADLVVGDPPEADDERADGDDHEDEDDYYSFDEPVDATGEAVVEIETREGNGDEPSFVFDPHHVRLDEGATVRWTNTDGIFHTVTSTDDRDTRRGGGEEFDETISSESDSFEWEADEAGTQHYYCSPHAEFMFGSLEIE